MNELQPCISQLWLLTEGCAGAARVWHRCPGETDVICACHACCRGASASACCLAWVPKLAAAGAWLLLCWAPMQQHGAGAHSSNRCFGAWQKGAVL
jgi:hypothetical protein